MRDTMEVLQRIHTFSEQCNECHFKKSCQVGCHNCDNCFYDGDIDKKCACLQFPTEGEKKVRKCKFFVKESN